MNRSVMVLIVGCAMSVAASAVTVPGCATNTWTFSASTNGAQCASGTSFTANGETITIFSEELMNGTIQGGPNYVSGLFEVGKGQSGNLASGIAPYVPIQGGTPFTGQGGIQDMTYSGNTYDAMLYIEVSQNGANPVPSGTVLNFLMQEGDVADYFDVYTITSATNTLPNLTTNPTTAGWTTVANDMSVAHNNVGNVLSGNASQSQFSVTTSTTSGSPYEFIAIKADCTYLLLNSITAHAPSVPEPRFYGFLLASLFGVAGVIYQRRRSASQTV